MAFKNSTYVYIDGINVSGKTVLPLKVGNFLDERLDEAFLSLRGIKQEVIAPLTNVDVVLVNEFYRGNGDKRKTIQKNKKVIHFIVANDNVEETMLGSGLYNHELYLIEATKAAECVVVDTLTFTNDLGRSYSDSLTYADPIWE